MWLFGLEVFFWFRYSVNISLYDLPCLASAPSVVVSAAASVASASVKESTGTTAAESSAAEISSSGATAVSPEPAASL